MNKLTRFPSSQNKVKVETKYTGKQLGLQKIEQYLSGDTLLPPKIVELNIPYKLLKFFSLMICSCNISHILLFSNKFWHY